MRQVIQVAQLRALHFDFFVFELVKNVPGGFSRKKSPVRTLNHRDLGVAVFALQIMNQGFNGLVMGVGINFLGTGKIDFDGHPVAGANGQERRNGIHDFFDNFILPGLFNQYDFFALHGHCLSNALFMATRLRSVFLKPSLPFTRSPIHKNYSMILKGNSEFSFALLLLAVVVNQFNDAKYTRPDSAANLHSLTLFTKTSGWSK